MKKIITISTVVVFALALGLVYAGSSMAMSGWDNGITIFAAGSVSTGAQLPDRGEPALGERLTHPVEVALDNGVTLFAAGPISTGENYKVEEMSGYEGIAAGGYEESAPALDVRNGITIFDSAPVD